MVTYTGKQDDLFDALNSLLELEYDVIEAYKVAIDRLENETYKNQMDKFKKDHDRHVKEISNFVKNSGATPAKDADIKQYVTKGKVILAKLVGDKAILMAMRSNEEDSNTAYQRMLKHKKVSDACKEIISKAYEDEKHHKKWINDTLKGLEK